MSLVSVMFYASDSLEHMANNKVSVLVSRMQVMWHMHYIKSPHQRKKVCNHKEKNFFKITKIYVFLIH